MSVSGPARRGSQAHRSKLQAVSQSVSWSVSEPARRGSQACRSQLQQLAERYQAAVHDARALHDKLQRQRQLSEAAQESARAAAQQLAALRRRLGRAQEGGVELVDAAEELSSQVEAARKAPRSLAVGAGHACCCRTR